MRIYFGTLDFPSSPPSLELHVRRGRGPLPADRPHGGVGGRLGRARQQRQVQDGVGPQRRGEDEAGGRREYAGPHAAADEEEGRQATGDVHLLGNPRVARAELP